MIDRDIRDIGQPAKRETAFEIRTYRPRQQAMLEDQRELPRVGVRAYRADVEIVTPVQGVELDRQAGRQPQFDVRSDDYVLRVGSQRLRRDYVSHRDRVCERRPDLNSGAKGLRR